MPRPFVLFGLDHVAALTLIASEAAGLCLVVRRRPQGRLARAVRLGLCSLLIGGTAATLVRWAEDAPLSVWDILPLHLCDALILVAALALLTRRQILYELLYFCGCGGTLLALLTPDVQVAFPDWRFVSYFLLHGLVVVSALTLTLGFRMQPRQPWRAFLILNAYAAAAAVVNAAFGTNYLFLRRKPGAPTPLDWFGPWPVYILAAEVLGLALFLVLDLPFRRQRAARPYQESS